MSAETLVRGLAAWWLGAALFWGVALLLPRLVRLDPPAARLRYWQVVLLAALLLPVGELWPRAAEEVAPRFFADFIRVVAELPGPAAAPSVWELTLVSLALGASARLAWLGLGLRSLARWRREAESLILPPELAPLLASSPGVQVAVSPRVRSPLAFGWRRPVILVPPSFASSPLPTQRAILGHELLHLEWRHWPLKLGEQVLLSLLWFHPALWLLARQLELAREQSVDAEVVRRSGERRSYLEALLGVARSGQLHSASLPFLHHRHLLARVAQLSKEVPMSRRLLRVRLALFAFVLAIVALAVTATLPVAARTSKAASGTATVIIEETIHRVGGDVQAPKVLERRLPEYSEAARRDKVQGVVIAEALINKQGEVRSTKLLKGLHEDLDREAIASLREWTFEPATRHGEPVSVYFVITVHFQLDDKTGEAER